MVMPSRRPTRPPGRAAASLVDGWRTTRWRLSLALLLLGAALVAIFATRVQALAAPPLRLAVSRGTVSLLIYVAEAQQYFDAEAVRVQLRDCSSGRQCFAQLADGSADLATAAELVVTLGSSAGGNDAVILATLSASSRQIKLVASREAGIGSAADLRRKRIATVKGSSAEYFIDRWLLYHDVDPRQVSVLGLDPDQLVGALQRRETDAVAIWEPLASAAAAALADDALVWNDPQVYRQHFNLVAGRRLVGERRVELIKLLRALARAQRFVAENPQQARQILIARLKADIPADSLAQHDFRLALDHSLLVTMESQARWAAQRSEAVAKAARVSEPLRLIDGSLLDRAVPGSTSLVQ